MIAGPLAIHPDYHEVVEEIVAHLLSLAPASPVVHATGRHAGEPLFFNRAFPAMAVMELGNSEEPRGSEEGVQPGAIDLAVRFYNPSFGTLAERDGRKVSEAATRKAYAGFRRRLYEPASEASTMGGRVRWVALTSSSAGDMDRFGNRRATDFDTDSTLWVHQSDLRVFL